MKKEQIASEIEEWGKRNGNVITIVDMGKTLEKREVKDSILEGLDDEERNIIHFSLDLFHRYLSSFMFVDGFGVDHDARREWEKNHLHELSEEAEEQYSWNRIGGNKFFQVISYADVCRGAIKSRELVEELSYLFEALPKEMINRIGDNLEYSHLENDGKIYVIKKFDNFVKKIIKFFQK